MPVIRASCPTCGDVELTTEDVRVRVCADGAFDDHGEYSFRCPDCRMTVVKQADRRTLDLLVSSGVAQDTWSLPAELSEPREGRPISHDELLDFHALLADEESLAAAIDTMRRL